MSSWTGLILLISMYSVVLALGFWAGRRPKSESSVSELMLAGRSLPLSVALLTMIATWVGGGYINGTAEYSYTAGAYWGGQAGLGFAMSLIVGGLVFARPMRKRGYSTLIDPFEQRYGKTVAVILMVPAVLAEVIWSGAILVALGTTFSTLLDLNVTAAILISATISIGYTLFGGLRAVAYTDVAQLGFIVLGLLLALPFVIQQAGGLAPVLSDGFPAIVDPKEALSYADWSFLLILGGIPWNVYFQRVLSSKNERVAVQLSVAAGPICALLAIPPLLMGLAATHLDWTVLAGPEAAMRLSENSSLVLPYLLKYATPTWVSCIALGAVSAAVMSSVDSSILSAASLVAWNGYHRLYAPKATPQQVTRWIRSFIIILGMVATLMALWVPNVKDLWYLCGDLVYCILFPQLTLALFDQKSNAPGALSGFLVSATVRLGGGVATLGLPTFLPYPDWNSVSEVDFPFRTIAMLAGLLTSIVISRATSRLYAPHPIESHLKS